MPGVMELCILMAFALFSLADLRYRQAPAIEVFFLGSVLIAAPERPEAALAASLALAWGLFQAWPGWLAWPLALFPTAWVVLLTGYGVRRGVIGRADLLAAAGIACLFPWPAPGLALLGVEFWRRGWARFRGGPAPALPGMFLGLAAYLAGKLALTWWQGGR